jgi:hypothetical protein
MPDAIASTFADPQDLARYNEAIANGATEDEALSVGDNGVGAWGDDTTSTTVPMVAVKGAPHNALIFVKGPGGSVVARNADKINSDRIDLNPAAAMAVGHPGGLAKVSWNFLDGSAPTSSGVSLGDNSRVNLGGNAQALMPAIDLLGNDDEDSNIPATPLLADNTSGIPSLTADDSGQSMSTDSDGSEGDMALASQLQQQNAAADASAQADGGGDFNASGRIQVLKGDLPPSREQIGPAVSYDKSTGLYTMKNGMLWDPKQQRLIAKVPGGQKQWSGENSPSEFYPESTKADISDAAGNKWRLDPSTGQYKNVTPAGFQTKLDAGTSKRLADRGLPEYDDQGNHLSPQQANANINDWDKTHLTDQQLKILQQVDQRANSARNKASLQYLNLKPQYDSIITNAAIPQPKRSGQDDAFLLSAAGGQELGNRATTEGDFKRVLEGIGYTDRFGVLRRRLAAAFSADPTMRSYQGSQFLPPATVQQLADASRRAFVPRADEYAKGLAPDLELLKTYNLSRFTPGLLQDAQNIVNGKYENTPAESATPAPSKGVDPNLALSAAQRIYNDASQSVARRQQAKTIIDAIQNQNNAAPQ